MTMDGRMAFWRDAAIVTVMGLAVAVMSPFLLAIVLYRDVLLPKLRRWGWRS